MGWSLFILTKKKLLSRQQKRLKVNIKSHGMHTWNFHNPGPPKYVPTEEYGRGLRWLAFRAHMLRGARCTVWTLMDWGFPWNVPWCSFRAIRQLIWPHFSGAHGSPTSQRFLRPFQLANADFISSGAVGITEKDWLGREPCFQHCPGIWGDTAHSLNTHPRSTLCAGRTELGDTAFPIPSPGAWHAVGNSAA